MASLANRFGIVTRPQADEASVEATASAMAKAGASLVIGNRNAKLGEEVVRAIDLAGGRCGLSGDRREQTRGCNGSHGVNAVRQSRHGLSAEVALGADELRRTRSKEIYVRTRLKRRNTGRVFSKLWLPAVVLVVIAIVSYGVNAVRHMSDAITNPPAKSSIPATVVQINPKNVTYEVFENPPQWREGHLRGSRQPANRSHTGVAALVSFRNDDGVLGHVEPGRTG